MAERLRFAGKAIDDDKAKGALKNIDAWLRDNPEAIEKTYELMETGLIWNLLSGTEASLPKSCTRIGLISQTIKRKQLAKLNPRLTAASFKLAMKKDGKIVNNMFNDGFGVRNATPMKGGMLMEALKQMLGQLEEAAGRRVQKYTIESDGTVDFAVKNGNYLMVVETGSGSDVTYEELDKKKPRERDPHYARALPRGRVACQP